MAGDGLGACGGEGTGTSTKARRSTFLHVLMDTGSVSLAARAADRKLSTCYRWRAQDAGFAAAWAAAVEVGYDRLEAALLDHALRIMTGAVTEGAAQGKGLSNADLQFVLGIVVRHRPGAAQKPGAPTGKGPTQDEVDMALRRALDGLARREAAA